jgi:hypothetical protein
MNDSARTHSGAGRRRKSAFLLAEQTEIIESEPSFWGGGWAERFTAHFDDPGDDHTPTPDDEIRRVVTRVIAHLPPIDRRIIKDYYVLCLSRRAIAQRRNLEEREVDIIRSRAERRLRGMLAGYVKRRFGIAVQNSDGCELCNAARRIEIDQCLSGRHPSESWGALRRRLNREYGLAIKRVQVVMSHCRYHMLTDIPPVAGDTETGGCT